jgi:hypothetical protein
MKLFPERNFFALNSCIFPINAWYRREVDQAHISKLGTDVTIFW